MSKPSSKRLETHPVYSHQCDDRPGTVIAVDYVYLPDDPGGARIVLSDADGIKVATVDPEVAIEIGHALIKTGCIAQTAEKLGVAPDAVPSEWTES